MRRPTNRLAAEKSPYLLQHAHNPVDWRPWGEEAFAAARDLDKPIFLSIGYSTCHWCHVMERESFEHEETARLLNDAFVCVKADREERPDLDAVYMAACQMLTGRGGWPLTLLLTPQGEPFFAATYLPRESRFGQAGLSELARQASAAWSTDRERIAKSAAGVAAAMRQAFAPAAPAEIPEQAFARGLDHFRKNFDARHGGFGAAPKFPSPHHILFLLRCWRRTGDPQARHMAEHTLRRMRLGGIFDQVGLGFHRYSTDESWLTPHFEKMLYDQGLLLMAYAETFQATADPFFARVCRELAAYLRRDLRGPEGAEGAEGAFHSAEDADSEGEEGRFYVWTLEQLDTVLGRDEARFWAGRMGLSAEGNFRDEATGRATGTNILHFPAALTPDLEERWEAARQKLLTARAARVRPSKDDKVLADWNGLAVAGLALAGRALGDGDMVRDAGRAADFVLRAMRRPDGRLLHRWRVGEAAVDGLAEDYAFLAWGLAELFAATLDAARLDQARQLADILLADFWDPDQGGLFLTPEHGEALLMRPREAFDAALPSANSVALLLLPRLFRLTGEAAYADKAQAIAQAFGAPVEAAPFGHALFLCGLDLARRPGADVRLTGDPQAEPALSMRRALDRRFLPDLTLAPAPAREGLAAAGPPSPAAARVCRAGTCSATANTVEELLKALEEA